MVFSSSKSFSVIMSFSLTASSVASPSTMLHSPRLQVQGSEKKSPGDTPYEFSDESTLIGTCLPGGVPIIQSCRWSEIAWAMDNASVRVLPWWPCDSIAPLSVTFTTKALSVHSSSPIACFAGRPAMVHVRASGSSVLPTLPHTQRLQTVLQASPVLPASCDTPLLYSKRDSPVMFARGIRGAHSLATRQFVFEFSPATKSFTVALELAAMLEAMSRMMEAFASILLFSSSPSVSLLLWTSCSMTMTTSASLVASARSVVTWMDLTREWRQSSSSHCKALRNLIS
mmetsp:Transcript_21101/g.41002  ORF Transcript_21101/g.41002 Transcript_21101/m.41002 type:complete len:285 (-) Transcript_21101:217-1071(-)